MYYSKSSGGFYCSELHGSNIPVDVVEISQETYAELFVGQSSGKSIVPDSEGRPVLVSFSNVDVRAENLYQLVDAAADAVRTKLIGDPLRLFEYEAAAREAETFVASGCRGTVPPMVAAWVANGRTAQQAADDILQEAARCKTILVQLRTRRLNYKELIRRAISAGDNESAKTVAADAVAAINVMFCFEENSV